MSTSSATNIEFTTWPNAAIRGCCFHFKQCPWRNFDRLGLTSEYQVVGSDIRRSFQNIGALPFLPIEDVLDAWIELKPTIPFDMDDFARYFEYTWIGTTGQRALFPPSAWNHHDASLALLPRSSNMAEGWHNGFRSLVRCSNPTIWSFLDALKLEQRLTDQKIAERLLLHPAPPDRRSGLTLTILKLFVRYVDDTLAVFDTRANALLFLKYLNSLHSNIKFTMECEEDEKLAFLDLLIMKSNDNIELTIYRKPTHSGVFTHFTSLTIRYRSLLTPLIMNSTVATSNSCQQFHQFCFKTLFMPFFILCNIFIYYYIIYQALFMSLFHIFVKSEAI